ncbi:MAG: ABC transporter permease [Oscillospiraceae bacterium]|jgi:spermidine/putrescine transport system permease protein|nr:ABC transporter permease [Oscillospiraceae bacterium]
MKRAHFALPYGLWMLLFTIVPMFLIVYYACTNEDGGFTLANFGKFLEPRYVGVLTFSLWLAFLCTVFCLLIGYPAALFLVSRDFKRSSIIVVLFVIPMWMNFLLRTYAWMSLLEDTGLINRFLEWLGFERVSLMYTENAVLMGMVYNFLPFMIFPIYSVLQKNDSRLIEAAQDLGANAWRSFWKVTFPLSIPGVVSGITMVFMPAVTTFVLPRLLGGGMFMMFGDLIESQFLTTGNWNFGSALSMIMMALILVSLGILNKADPNNHRQAAEGGGLW